MSATDALYATLLNAIDTMADRLSEVDTGEVFGNFTCDELDSIAEVLRAAGRDDVADFIIEEHASADDEGDAHYRGPVCSCSDPATAAITGHGHACELYGATS